MCSDLFTIPIEIGGVPIFGFGVLLAAWLLIGGGILWRTVSQHGWLGEATSFLFMYAVVAAGLLLIPRLFPAGLPIRGYGAMLVVAAIAGVALASYRAEQMGVSRDVILSMTVWMFVCGIVGARLFYVIEYWDERFRAASFLTVLGRILNFPEGGLVIYGGLIGGLVGFVWCVRSYRLPIRAMADIVAPSFMLGLALGRIGCLLNGCCYGGVADVPWAISFPRYSAETRVSAVYQSQFQRGEMHGFRLGADPQHRPVVARVDPGLAADRAGLQTGLVVTAVNGEPVANLEQAEEQLAAAFWIRRPLELETSSSAHGGSGYFEMPAAEIPARSRPVHPTQIYSTINALLVCWLLWSYYPFRRSDGEVFVLMLTVYPIGRFLLEVIRTDESAIFGTGLSISQNISVLIFVGALAAWGYLRLNPPRLALPQSAPT